MLSQVKQLELIDVPAEANKIAPGITLAIKHEFEFVGKATRCDYHTAMIEHPNESFCYSSGIELV